MIHSCNNFLTYKHMNRDSHTEEKTSMPAITSFTTKRKTYLIKLVVRYYNARTEYRRQAQSTTHNCRRRSESQSESTCSIWPAITTNLSWLPSPHKP